MFHICRLRALLQRVVKMAVLKMWGRFAALLVVLTGCAGEQPLPGMTGRVGASFRVELDVTVDGVPLHLVHDERCLEYRMGTGFTHVWAHEPAMIFETGGFSVRQGGWTLLAVAPNMCRHFNDQPRRKGDSVFNITIPIEEQSLMPPKSLWRDYLPLLALRPDGDGPLRLYMSKDALTRPGDPLRFGAITGMVPASGGPAANTQPLPVRPMLHGSVPGTCYRGWVLSPADPKAWAADPEIAGFLAAATRPMVVPDDVAKRLDPRFANPWAAHWRRFLEDRFTPSAFDTRSEKFVAQGARSLAMVRTVEEGLFSDRIRMTDWSEWTQFSNAMVYAMAGHSLAEAGLPSDGRPSYDYNSYPETLIPLHRSGTAYQPAPDQRGLAEAWPGQPECGDLLAGEIPVALGDDILPLRPFTIVAWPQAGTFVRLVPVDVRFPTP